MIPGTDEKKIKKIGVLSERLQKDNIDPANSIENASPWHSPKKFCVLYRKNEATTHTL